MTVPGIEHPIEGKVTVVSPALDPNSTTVEIWLEAKNPKHAVEARHQRAAVAHGANRARCAGRPGNVRAHGARWDDSVMVAGSDGRAHQNRVKLGIRNGDDVQILDGLSASDKVVSTGAYGLPDKTKIKIEAAELAESAKRQAGRLEGRCESSQRGSSDK